MSFVEDIPVEDIFEKLGSRKYVFPKPCKDLLRVKINHFALKKKAITPILTTSH